jgi:uncharacterized membrane protein
MIGSGGSRRSLVGCSCGLGAVWLLLVSCGPAASAPTYCEVKPVLDAHCVRCHAVPAQQGAPFSLATYASLRDFYGDQVIYERVSEAVTSGVMPPTRLDLQPPVEPLAQDEIALLSEWALAGAPSGGCQ